MVCVDFAMYIHRESCQALDTCSARSGDRDLRVNHVRDRQPTASRGQGSRRWLFQNRRRTWSSATLQRSAQRASTFRVLFGRGPALDAKTATAVLSKAAASLVASCLSPRSNLAPGLVLALWRWTGIRLAIALARSGWARARSVTSVRPTAQLGSSGAVSGDVWSASARRVPCRCAGPGRPFGASPDGQGGCFFARCASACELVITSP